jgi:hypothetical protein
MGSLVASAWTAWTRPALRTFLLPGLRWPSQRQSQPLVRCCTGRKLQDKATLTSYHSNKIFFCTLAVYFVIQVSRGTGGR